jgi:hypothetical protein
MTDNQTYSIDDFKTGDRVYPTDLPQLHLIVISINKEQRKIVCQLENTGMQHEFTPEELKKRD